MQTATLTEVLKRTFLQRFDVPGSQFETVIGITDVAPNDASGRQSHPGPEGGYILEGALTIFVDGQPPVPLTAGQSWKVAPGVPHDVRGGPSGAKVLVTWVVEKGKPFAAPAK